MVVDCNGLAVLYNSRVTVDDNVAVATVAELPGRRGGVYASFEARQQM